MWEQCTSCNCYINVAWILPKTDRLCFCPRFAIFFSFYGLVMSLQSFGINIYLMQALFTIVRLFYFLGFLATKLLDRRRTQMASSLLSGICILACVMIPLGEEHMPHSCSCSGPFPDPNLTQTSYLTGRKDPSLLPTVPSILSSLHFLPDLSFLHITIAVLGKDCLASCLNCIFMYTPEQYLTVIR